MQAKKRRSTDLRGYALKASLGDRPFQYSAEHQAWHAAVRRNDERGIREHGAAWARRFIERRPAQVAA